MTSRSLTFRALFLSVGIVAFAVPASAGFEFSGKPAGQAAPMPSQQDFDAAMLAPLAADAPMPIVPAVPVQSEALPPLRPADMVTRDLAVAASGSEPVYVRRQRTGTAPVSASSSLVINPYPMQARGVDVIHGDAGTEVSIEQAMMEQTGKLKTVALPGSSGAGMIARADNAPRINAAPLGAPEISRNMAQVQYGDGMTPMPGGELPPLNAPLSQGSAIDAQPLMPVMAAAPSYPKAAAVYPNAVPVQPNYAPLSGNGGFAEAVGFGKELPLALALSQVVPADYNFSFGQSVNAGETVSWQGGKSWDQVLQEMLQPVGMRAVINGKQVTIQSAV